LDRIELSPANEKGYFEPTTQSPLILTSGQTLRVTLYWQALQAPNAERTISVRINDASGFMVAQQDMQPGNGTRPTSWWQPGWTLRDVYYLTIPPEAQVGTAALNLVLYDSFTQEIIPFDNGTETLKLFDLNLQSVP
ncbi:MAG: hypothetical protein KC421_17985, partial [Anaerolineales bacterium]|nr:hypothetical protein [Anaerolineales bacterium]